MTTRSRTLPLSARGFNFEMFMWIFTRLSALAMYAFILAGLIGALIVSAQTRANLADVLRWAFFPNAAPNPLGAMPWATVLAKTMVAAFILTLSAHGVHGVLEILDDYFASPSWRRAYRNAIILFYLAANAFALYVILTS